MDGTGLGVIALGLCCVLRPTLAQNYENVATGKTYDQSSAYVPSNPTHNTANPASYAANGNTDGTYSSANCIHTAFNDNNDWWEVDLGTRYPLYNFKVWGRTNSQNRLYPFTITVDGQTCASKSSGTFRSVDVTCSSIMYGQVVRFARTSDNEMINMCEFQVFVCRDGWWDLGCNRLCSSDCTSCDRSTGSCTVNVAQGKTYNQSSACVPQNPASPSNPASYAANGNTDGDYNQNNCIHTQDNDPDDWWEVDLGAVYPLYNFKVWGRHSYSYRLYPFTITVDSQICDSVSTMSDRSVDVTCSSIMYGQVVRITRTNNNQMLNMCEFQIFVCVDGRWGQQCNSLCSNCLTCDRSNGSCAGSQCIDGRWGANCENQCSSNCVGTTCERQTGSCSACVAGWYGDQCDTRCRTTACLNNQCDQQTGYCTACPGYFDGDLCAACSDGYHGADCRQTCSPAACRRCDQNTGACQACRFGSNMISPACTDCLPGYYRQFPSSQTCTQCTWTCHQDTVCDPDSADCPVCPPGRKGNRCGQDCDGNMYGQNCSTPCGHCTNREQCDVVTGQCLNSCQPGFQPPLCVTECSDREYGPDCQETCGQCRDGAVCDKVTGHCPLCPPGLYQPLCNTECLNGTFGDNCSEECGACEGGVPCNKQTGHCPCPVGKQPPFCKLDCQNNMYGADCTQTCGQCRDDRACDPVNGHCSDGCQPGWTDLDQSSTLQFCQTACPAGLYGERCNQTCGQCQAQAACSHDTGHCSQGCADGYTGPLCLQASDNQSGGVEKLIGPIVGAIVGVGLLMTISLTAAVCWRRRSRDGPDRMESATAPPAGPAVELRDVDTVETVSSPLPPPDPKEEQLYTTITDHDNDNYDKLHPYSNDNADRSPYADLTSDSIDVNATTSHGIYVNATNTAGGMKNRRI